MKKVKENFIYAFIMFLEFAFIFLISKKCYIITEIKYLIFTLMFVIVIAMGFILLSGLKSFYKYKVMRIILWSSLILMLILCLRNNDFILKSRLGKDILKLNVDIGQGNPTYFKDYLSIFMILGPIVSLIFLAIVKSDFMELLVLVNLAIYLFFYNVGYEIEIENFKFLFGAINLFIFLIGGYRRYIDRLKAKGIKLNLNKADIMGKGIGVILLITTIFSITSNDSKGIHYNEINSMVSSALKGESHRISDIIIDEKGIAKSGYIDTDKKLGGPLTISKDEVFKVYSHEGNLYLRAAVKDEYTGDSWRRSNRHTFSNEENLKSEDKEKKVKGETKTIKIETLNEGYGSYFTPINTIKVKNDKENSVYWNKENNLYMNNKKITSEYEVEFFDEPKMNDINYTLKGSKSDMYLKLPSSIPNRVHQLAADITKNSTNDFEKVRQIKDYLSRNYFYDTNVSNIPEGVDFVDYFLFSEKKGYCVYFATSFTVLARAAGVKTRYVEGFKTTNNITPEGYILVTEEDAHAWAEVLIDPNSEQWSTVDCSPTLRAENQDKPSELSTMGPNITGMSGQQGDNNQQKINNNLELEEESSSSKTSDKKKLNIKGLRYPRRFLVSSFLAGILLFILLKLLKSITLVKRALDKKSVRPLYSYVLRRLKSIGYIKEKFETDREFINRIDDRTIKTDLSKLVDEVYKEFYGNEVGSFENRKEFLKRMEDCIKSKNGKLEYIFKRYYKN